MKLLTKKRCRNHMKMEKSVIFVTFFIWKICENKYVKDKKHCKTRNHCHYIEEHRGAAHSICTLKYNVSKKIPIDFHNGYNYDYHFIITEIADVKKRFT